MKSDWYRKFVALDDFRKEMDKDILCLDTIDEEVCAITKNMSFERELKLNNYINHNPKPEVPFWSVEKVCKWISSHKFPASVVATFQEAHVDGDILLQITDRNLKEDLGMVNGILRKRFMRELNCLKNQADYSAVDPDNMAEFLGSHVGVDYKHYTYNLIKSGLGIDLMRKLGEGNLDDMLIEAGITSSIHRKKIIDAIIMDENNTNNIANQIRDLTINIDRKSSSTSINNGNFDVYVCFDKRHSAELASLINMQLQMRGFLIHTNDDHQGSQEKALEKIEEVKNFILVINKDTFKFNGQVGQFVQREIRAALSAKCNIIPILDSTKMPDQGTLAETVRAVTEFNAVNWVHDYQEACIDKIEKFILGEPFFVVDTVGRASSAGSGRSSVCDSGRSTPARFLTPIMGRKNRMRTASSDSLGFLNVSQHHK